MRGASRVIIIVGFLPSLHASPLRPCQTYLPRYSRYSTYLSECPCTLIN